MATSGGTRGVAVAPMCRSLATIRNSPYAFGVASSIANRSMIASGGGSKDSERQNSSTLAGSPSMSINTPWVPFRTDPLRPPAVARRCTKGRNPTPCTTPSTAINRRCSIGNYASHKGPMACLLPFNPFTLLYIGVRGKCASVNRSSCRSRRDRYAGSISARSWRRRPSSFAPDSVTAYISCGRSAESCCRTMRCAKSSA